MLEEAKGYESFDAGVLSIVEAKRGYLEHGKGPAVTSSDHISDTNSFSTRVKDSISAIVADDLVSKEKVDEEAEDIVGKVDLVKKKRRKRLKLKKLEYPGGQSCLNLLWANKKNRNVMKLVDNSKRKKKKLLGINYFETLILFLSSIIRVKRKRIRQIIKRGKADMFSYKKLN